MQSIKERYAKATKPFISLVAFLWLLNVVSAVAVVSVTQDVRKNIGGLEQLRLESAQLQVQWGQYLLEQSTLASFSRIETQAVEKLGMQVPDPEQIILVKGE